MLWSKEKIQQTIVSALPDAQVAVDDLTGTSDHFQVTIVHQGFSGVSSIDRHRQIYDILGQDVGGAIHALSLKTYTPQQWETLSGEK